MSNIINNINKYLWCGYLPPETFPNWLFDCINSEIKGNKYNPREAADRFDSLFDVLLEHTRSESYIIPLSGGWDSRAIFGALLERIEPDRIVTVTFGSPGQLDYDIGIMVAKWAGVNHRAIDLRSINFSWDLIKNSVIASPWTYVPDNYFNQLSRVLFSESCDTIWSGFLGGLPGGNHLNNMVLDIGKSVNSFSSKQQRCQNIKLYSPNFSLSSFLPIPYTNLGVNWDDIFHQGIRQINCIAPIVLPIQKLEHWGAHIGKEINGANVIAPFADRSWAGYWLTAPRKVRINRNLYGEMLNKKFPELFSLPSKHSFGQPKGAHFQYLLKKSKHSLITNAKKVAPWSIIKSSLLLNYLDYDEMFRYRSDYKNTLASALNYLNENQVVPWLNLKLLWEEHMRGRKCYGDAFCVLIGLAANLCENLNDYEN